MEFNLNKEKDQVMKTKEKLCQKRLFRNLQASRYCTVAVMHTLLEGLEEGQEVGSFRRHDHG